MKSHEYAELFPMASEAELSDMSVDIKKHGLLNPIIILDGKILDGRNRYKACQMAEVEPKTKEYSGNDPLNDVISWNLHRRHLTTDQKAALAVELKPMFEKQAEKNLHLAKGQGVKGVANLPQVKSRDKVAKTVGISGRTVGYAEKVKKAHEMGDQIVVVVSAMSGETNRLIGLAKEMQAQPIERELDVLISTGEQVTMALLSKRFA